VSGRTRHWLKFKNPAVAAVKREAEEDWGEAALALALTTTELCTATGAGLSSAIPPREKG